MTSTSIAQIIHGATIILASGMLMTGTRLAATYIRAAHRARSWQLVPDACFMTAWVCTAIGIIANQHYRWNSPIRWTVQGPISIGFFLFIVAAISLERRAAHDRILNPPHRRRDDVAIRPLHTVASREEDASRR